MKTYTHDDVRVSFHHPLSPDKWTPETTGYVRLFFSYGLKTLEAGRTKYHPLSFHTGIPVKLMDWPARGEMTPGWIADHKDLFFQIIEQKKAVIDAFNRASQTLGRTPFPADIKRFLKGEVSDKTTPVLFTEWAEEHIQSVRLHPRTIAKYRTAIQVVRAVELARTRKDFKRFGTGPIYLQSFSLNDWKDIDNLLDIVSVPATIAIREGADGLRFDPEHPFYSQNTKQKFQSNVKALLRMAEEDGFTLSVKLPQIKTCSLATNPTKVILTADQLDQLIQTKFPLPDRENARKLMVIQVMTACRYSDLGQYVTAKLEQHTVDGRTFFAIRSRSMKTDTDQLIPVFGPALSILQAEDRPWMISNQKLNDHYQRIAQDLGWTDNITAHTYRARGKTGVRVDQVVPFDQMVSTHTMRRTCYSLLRGLGISPDLTALIGGWAVSDDAHFGYLHLAPDMKAKVLLDEVEERQHRLPFRLVA